MELIDQRAKKIMEECKERARAAGLQFENETLEYIVSNRDLLELSPKNMIPTLYDYWVHDVEVLKEYGKYKLYPTNPYETVINSRPAISFYNSDNPDWLNIMIFYHVLAHIDFFQNNIHFKHTWDEDFVGMALADKRLIASLRNQYGRWVDYVIEFARSLDNIVGFYDTLFHIDYPFDKEEPSAIEYYFNNFLQEELKLPQHQLFAELGKYNQMIEEKGEKIATTTFLSEITLRYPEFDAKYKKFISQMKQPSADLLEFIRDNSPFLKKEKNEWMKTILTIIRNTALYFAPQVRTKIINEGWASYWHDELFRRDDRIHSHETDYARVNAYVTSISRLGLNPYAIGLRLIQYVEELAEKGKLNYEFQKIESIEERENYDKKTGEGKKAIFNLRKYFSDFTLLNIFITQEFVDKHDLFVVGIKPDFERQTVQYYVKSRKAEDYKKMILDALYHPPYITVDLDKTSEKLLYLVHNFEGKQLIKEFVPDVLVGIEFLWGGEVNLETTEIIADRPATPQEKPKYRYQKVLWVCKDRKVTRRNP
ncbi:MAG: SpoVR-like protein [Candidatus Kapaibacterium sp.]|nr:MAG: SpoVR-like protein [Candidatus Kapabacteria bacterium]